MLFFPRIIPSPSLSSYPHTYKKYKEKRMWKVFHPISFWIGYFDLLYIDHFPKRQARQIRRRNWIWLHERRKYWAHEATVWESKWRKRVEPRASWNLDTLIGNQRGKRWEYYIKERHGGMATQNRIWGKESEIEIENKNVPANEAKYVWSIESTICHPLILLCIFCVLSLRLIHLKWKAI